MPKIGLPTSAMITAPWKQVVATASENGFGACEITCLPPMIDLDNLLKEDVNEARRIAEKANIELCIHDPFFELNIAAFTKSVRDDSVQEILKAIDFCAELGGKSVIVHPGINTYNVAQTDAQEKDILL
jgi:endonuclease IV